MRIYRKTFAFAVGIAISFVAATTTKAGTMTITSITDPGSLGAPVIGAAAVPSARPKRPRV